MGDFAYGAKSLGRLKFRTAEEARGAARDLGLSGIHSHMMDGERVYMPGETHTNLNDALSARNLPPTAMPGSGMDSGMGSGMDMSMAQSDADMGKVMSDAMGDADMAALDGNGSGGELMEAGMPGLDEMTATLDGMGMGGEMTTAAFDTGDVDVAIAEGGAGQFNLYGGDDAVAEADPLTDDFKVVPGSDSFDAAADLPDLNTGKQESVAQSATKGLFVGDEDGDGEMEIY